MLAHGAAVHQRRPVGGGADGGVLPDAPADPGAGREPVGSGGAFNAARHRADRAARDLHHGGGRA